MSLFTKAVSWLLTVVLLPSYLVSKAVTESAIALSLATKVLLLAVIVAVLVPTVEVKAVSWLVKAVSLVVKVPKLWKKS